MERLGVGGDAGQFLCQQSSMSYGRVEGEGWCQQSSMSYGRVEGEGCDGLLPVPRGEGRVQHEVCGDGVLEELQDGGFVLPGDEEFDENVLIEKRVLVGDAMYLKRRESM